jgi:molybdenum cofactor cytidylyltransferase
VLILSGGLSKRMAMPKAWLPFNAEQTFLEKIISEYSAFGCKHITVVINSGHGTAEWTGHLRKLSSKVHVVMNEFPEKGRSYSIQLGMARLAKDDFLFIQNIDNPFVDTELLQAMHAERKKALSVVPAFKEKRGHPVLISPGLVEVLRKMKASKLNLREVINDNPCREIAWNDEKILANINTEEDYEKYFNMRPLLSSIVL